MLPFSDNLIIDSFSKLKNLAWESKIDGGAGFGPLIFPSKELSAKPVKRISEQEEKYLFCMELWKNDIPFSIETPSVNKYSFTGKEKSSGNIDVCIHDKTGKRLSNIEFKALNQGDFDSDFEKLYCEKGHNCFVHIPAAKSDHEKR